MDSLLLLLVGLLGLGGGVMNILGYITASPRANRKVPEEFRRVYGRCVGAGTALIGAAFCAVGILRWVAYSQQVDSYKKNRQLGRFSFLSWKKSQLCAVMLEIERIIQHQGEKG